jgi:archaellum biogenesis ATPase FlaH
MGILETREEWLRQLLPEGFLYPTSTIISGKGGSGKPLVEFAFLRSWLESGGSAVGIPLQYPTAEFVKEAMLKIYDVDLEKYKGRMAHIQFDHTIKTLKKTGNNVLKANLLKADVWKEAVSEAEQMIEKSSLGTLVFGSALNLLLFSPTYREEAVTNIRDLLAQDKTRTYIFSVSTSAFVDEIKIWEQSADNLMYTRMASSGGLFFRIDRMKSVKFLRDEVRVPIAEEVLEEIRDVAETTRTKTIPELRKI